MDERELRSLVREAVERHLGRPQGATTSATHVAPYEGPYERPDVGRQDIGREVIGRARLQSRLETTHPSHLLLKIIPGSDVDDGMCVIEPAVRCNHCGFCQSFGH